MHARWRSFELPVRILAEEETLSPTYGKFMAEPFERGFSITVGNSLRRVLLSSLEGAAVTTVKIEGVPHEYTSIEGVVEDVTDIILNLKKLLVTCESTEPQKIHLSAEGEGVVTGHHIETHGLVEIVNPDLHICTLADDSAGIDMELEVRRGRGYKTASENQVGDQEIGVIPIDSIFSPVERVRYQSENTRVGQMTNYERLILEIWTKGTLSPELALVEAAKIFRKHLNPFVKYFELGAELAAAKDGGAGDVDLTPEEMAERLQLSVAGLQLSARTATALEAAEIQTVADLVEKTEDYLADVRNLGKSSVREIKKKLADLGLSLGINLETVQA